MVTKVQFTLLDETDRAEVRDCALFRRPLGAAEGVSTAQEVAQVQSTGMDAMPGKVRYADTSILRATVNNINYAYWLQCQINFHNLGGTPGAGNYGASITYTISTANG